MRSRSRVWPSGSTRSTWCSSQSRALDLRIWATSSGTRSLRSYALRTWFGFCLAITAIRSYSAARSPSSASMASAAATARSARSALTACADAPRRLSTNELASWPVTENHCSMLMPCDCSWRTVPSTRRCRSLCTSGSGGSTSVSAVSASVTRPTSSWRVWLSLEAVMRSLTVARHAATLSSPRFSSTHSSVASGTTSCWTLLTLTTKSASVSVPFGVVVNVSSSPADAPPSRSSKSSATQPWPTS